MEFEATKAKLTSLATNLNISGTTITDFSWLVKFEGVVPHMYKDSEGKITVGIGHNISGNGGKADMARLSFELKDQTDLKMTNDAYLNKLGTLFTGYIKNSLPNSKAVPSILVDLITNPAKLNVHFFKSTNNNILKKISFPKLAEFEYDHIQTLTGKNRKDYSLHTILNLKDSEILRMFQKDIDKLYGGLSKGFAKEQQPEKIQMALIDMSFNMGSGNTNDKYPNLQNKLSKAVKSKTADNSDDYLSAALETHRDPGGNKNTENRNIFVAECFFWVAASIMKKYNVSVKDIENKLIETFKKYRNSPSIKNVHASIDCTGKLENSITAIAANPDNETQFKTSIKKYFP